MKASKHSLGQKFSVEWKTSDFLLFRPLFSTGRRRRRATFIYECRKAFADGREKGEGVCRYLYTT